MIIDMHQRWVLDRGTLYVGTRAVANLVIETTASGDFIRATSIRNPAVSVAHFTLGAVVDHILTIEAVLPARRSILAMGPEEV